MISAAPAVPAQKKASATAAGRPIANKRSIISGKLPGRGRGHHMTPSRRRCKLHARRCRHALPQGERATVVVCDPCRIHSSGAAPRKWRRAPPGLFIEPNILHAPAVVDAVAHDGQPLYIGVLRVPARRVEDDRPHAVLRQLTLDLPHPRLELVLIWLDRLLVDQSV